MNFCKVHVNLALQMKQDPAPWRNLQANPASIPPILSLLERAPHGQQKGSTDLMWPGQKSDSRTVKQRFAGIMGDNVTLNTQFETKSENRNVTTDDW